jgi:hypothetical protein
MKRVFAILSRTSMRTLACSAAFALARLHFHWWDLQRTCYGINKLGQIVGDFEDFTLGVRGFLATPLSGGAALKPHAIRLRSHNKTNSLAPTFGGRP